MCRPQRLDIIDCMRMKDLSNGMHRSMWAGKVGLGNYSKLVYIYTGTGMQRSL